MSRPALFETDFQTSRPARNVFCHSEFLEKLEARRNEPLGKRVGLLLQRMAVDISRLHYKSTKGENRGWRRSRLGGSSGSHFYAWWAPAGAAPFKGEAGFDSQPEGVFLRDIRHHDDHSLLAPGAPDSDYLPLTVSDLRKAEYAPEPWTAAQARFAGTRGPVRILKGHPGSGKTTALLHAADTSNASRVLYLTFSQDLAALARDYFDRFCSGARTFTVLTFPAFLQQLTGRAPGESDGEGRARFRRDLSTYQRSLGSWATEIDALYDEMHAHLVGAAVPEAAGRFPKAQNLKLPEQAYRTQRTRYLSTAAESVLEAARRLDRPGGAPLADRYFPELAAAWRAAEALLPGSKDSPDVFSGYDCIAVDEVQDLTPLEAFVVIALARRLGSGGRVAPLLLAGDEAQTVRPTDFEWAWLNDMLHAMLVKPQEFKLAVNLRSPRRIADVVNRAWDYYDLLHKQDRPSGSGYAEIEDDGPDQVLYATVPTAEFPTLLTELTQREGLALVAFDKSNLPKELLPFVMSAAEAKGLDFHTVCVLNGGPLLKRIVEQQQTLAADTLGKRLAIDQLRVVLSRPTDRLLWVDCAPDRNMVKDVGHLLRPVNESELRPMTAEALRTCLAEEQLDLEERVQRCQRDARQLVSVKPDLAWSRAQQAVTLLGIPSAVTYVADEDARITAYLTLAEVCFQLGVRKKRLSPELGQQNLFEQAATAARAVERHLLSWTIRSVGLLEAAHGGERLNQIADAISRMTEAREDLPSWFIIEIMPEANSWLEELDRHMEAGDNPLVAVRLLPPFYDVLGFPDAAARKERLTQRAVQILMKQRRYAQALTILESQPNAKPLLLAECYEQTGKLPKAAATYLELGDRDKALKCYRAIPDFEEALKLVRQIEGHAARPSLEWLAQLEAVIQQRPDSFNRVMTTPEKKLLESMLERSLGVQRKKPATKKAGAGATAKKTAVKKAASRKRMPDA